MITAPRLDPVKELPGRVIDVMVWGASRPNLLAQTIEAFRQHVKFSGQLRYFFDDGDFDHEAAAESARIVEGYGFDGVNVERIEYVGRIGSYGWAMTKAMNRWCRAPLMFSFEDDMLCLRDIDLDLCFDLFAQHPHVNQLRYNRRKNAASQNDGKYVFAHRTLAINNTPYEFLSSIHWYFNPAVWRMAYIRPRWRGFADNIHHALNHHLNETEVCRGRRPTPDEYADVLGTLTWGDVGEPPFFSHIGREQSIHEAHGRV